MLHRLYYMIAGIFMTAGVWGLAKNMDNATWTFTCGFLIAIGGYLREIKFHADICAAHMRRRPPAK